MRAYAKQLCTPLSQFLSGAQDTISQLQQQSTPAAGAPTLSFEDAFTQGIALFGRLKEPLQTLSGALRDVEPPDDLRTYHQALLDEIDYAVKAVDALSTEGLPGTFALPTPEATPREPPDLEAAIMQECGEDITPFIDQFGADFFGGGAPAATPTVPPPGTVGRTVRSGNFELTVNSVTDPYVPSDETDQAEPGKRYVLLDVSLANVSTGAQDYTAFDFSLRDSDSYSYDPSYLFLEHELDFGSLLPGETIRGTLNFEVAQAATIDRLVYEPSFGAAGRIDIVLH